MEILTRILHWFKCSRSMDIHAATWRLTVIADRDKKEFLFNNDKQRVFEIPFCPKSLFTMRHGLKGKHKYRIEVYYEGKE